jgi:hypothetical protein
MYDAITSAFGWTGTLNSNERGQVNRASKLLRESGVKPEDLDSLYRWCKKQGWKGTFGPPAMANHVQEWRNKTGRRDSDAGTQESTPEDGTIAGPGKRWYRGKIVEAWTPDV